MDPKFGGGLGGRDYYDENNGYTYTWDVAHDFDGLIALMGGKAEGGGEPGPAVSRAAGAITI